MRKIKKISSSDHPDNICPTYLPTYLQYIHNLITLTNLRFRFFLKQISSAPFFRCSIHNLVEKKSLLYSALFVAVLFLGILPCDRETTAFAATIVMSAQNDLVIPGDGRVHKVYGTWGENHVTLEKGAAAHLFYFPGENIITMDTDSSKYFVSRSGAMVTIRSQDGTLVKIPATTQQQFIVFSSEPMPLQIRGHQIFLGNQRIVLEERPLDLMLPEPGANEHQPGDTWTEPVTGMEFVWVPAGSFMMGSSDDDPDANAREKPQHQVMFTHGFWMGKHEVTQRQWKAVMGSGNNPSHFLGDNLPVEQVSWTDAQDFIAAFNQISETIYALPTEAQWEYAARGGVEGQKYSGSDSADAVAWYRENKTHEVGTKEPNNWGLHDMSGNVFEWCEDWYDYYDDEPSENPMGPFHGSFRVNRGGSIANDETFLRPAFRSYNTIDVSGSNLGFRLVVINPGDRKEKKIWYRDADGDGHGNPSDWIEAVSQPEGYVADNTDCDDADPANWNNPVMDGNQPGDTWTEPVTGMEFVWVPAGSFMMGFPEEYPDTYSNEKPQHKVTLSQGFWMGKYEVTQGQWKQIMKNNPSWFQGDKIPAGVNADNLPVENVSWAPYMSGRNIHGQGGFIQKLNAATGLAFSLPTEAQWEYAARGGMENQAYSGSDDVDTVAWHYYNSDHRTHEVGTKKPNAWGLYDMSGNVEEWCEDWYDKNYYNNSPLIDPTGPSSGQTRVTRGGNFSLGARDLRSADRAYNTDRGNLRTLGFRLILVNQNTQQKKIWYRDADGDGHGNPDDWIKAVSQPDGYVADNTDCDDGDSTKRDTCTDQEYEEKVWIEPVTGMEFVWVPAGSFMMGSPDDEIGRGEDEKRHQVTLSQGFWMGRYEVTQGQWRQIMGSNPSEFQGERTPAGMDADNLPVEGVSFRFERHPEWSICGQDGFIQKLNAATGLVFSLPTEAQWEYAARAGEEEKTYSSGDDADNVGWYAYNSLNTTHEVGTKAPNSWGLYDMRGNVWEWCQDWKGDYPSGSVTDPMGPESGQIRVVRGGSWCRSARELRAADRNALLPSVRYNALGFRLIRQP